MNSIKPANDTAIVATAMTFNKNRTSSWLRTTNIQAKKGTYHSRMSSEKILSETVQFTEVKICKKSGTRKPITAIVNKRLLASVDAIFSRAAFEPATVRPKRTITGKMNSLRAVIHGI